MSIRLVLILFAMVGPLHSQGEIGSLRWAIDPLAAMESPRAQATLRVVRGPELSIDSEWTTIAKISGPGCLVRLALPHAVKGLRLRFDQEEPIEVSSEAISARTYPWLPGFSSLSEGRIVTQIPMGFRHSCEIEVKGPAGEVRDSTAEFLTSVEAGDIRPFSLKFRNDDLEWKERVSALSRTPGRWPGIPMRSDRQLRDRKTIEVGQPLVLFEDKGRGVLKSVRLSFFYLAPMLFRSVIFEVFYDGNDAPGISVPVGDLFGAPFGDPGPRALLAGMDEGGGYFHFPMPYQTAIKVTLRHALPSPVDVMTSVLAGSLSEGKLCWPLHATVSESAVQPNESVSACSLIGPGRLVAWHAGLQGVLGFQDFDAALNLLVDSGPPVAMDHWKQAFDVDAGLLPEDSSALSGNASRREGVPWRLAPFRHWSGAGWPFSKSLNLRLAFKSASLGSRFRSAVFWYGPGQVVPMVPADAPRLTRIPWPRGPGEGGAAALAWVAEVTRKTWEEFSEEFHSVGPVGEKDGRLILLPSGGAPDQRVAFLSYRDETSPKLRFSVKERGHHRVEVVLISAPKGPIVSISIDGKELAQVPTASLAHRPQKALSLTLELEAGEHELSLSWPTSEATAIGVDSFLVSKVD